MRALSAFCAHHNLKSLSKLGTPAIRYIGSAPPTVVDTLWTVDGDWHTFQEVDSTMSVLCSTHPFDIIDLNWGRTTPTVLWSTQGGEEWCRSAHDLLIARGLLAEDTSFTPYDEQRHEINLMHGDVGGR